MGGSRKRRPIRLASSKQNRPPSPTLPHKGGGDPPYPDGAPFLHSIALVGSEDGLDLSVANLKGRVLTRQGPGAKGG